MNETRSIDTLLDWLKNATEKRASINPSQFVEAATYMVILMGEEHEKLSLLKQNIAKMKVSLLKEYDKVNKVTLMVEASDEYREMKNQEARIANIEEYIRLAKLFGRLKSEELKNN